MCFRLAPQKGDSLRLRRISLESNRLIEVLRAHPVQTGVPETSTWLPARTRSAPRATVPLPAASFPAPAAQIVPCPCPHRPDGSNAVTRAPPAAAHPAPAVPSAIAGSSRTVRHRADPGRRQTAGAAHALPAAQWRRPRAHVQSKAALWPSRLNRAKHAAPAATVPRRRSARRVGRYPRHRCCAR